MAVLSVIPDQKSRGFSEVFFELLEGRSKLEGWGLWFA
jgi:hypothetical protein